MSTQQQPLKGHWVYAYSLSKHLFVDEHGRILDPATTLIPLPPRVEATSNQSTTIQNQTQSAASSWIDTEKVLTIQIQPQIVPQRTIPAVVPAPAPVVPPRPHFVTPAANPTPAPVVRSRQNIVNPTPAPVVRSRRNIVSPAAIPAPAPVVRSRQNIVKPATNPAPAPVVRRRPRVMAPANAPVPQRPNNRPSTTVAPRRSPAPAPRPQWTTVTNSGKRTVTPISRRPPARRTRSASVSSSGSSVRSRSNSKSGFVRYPSYYLNRKAVVRSGPSLNTRVKENLDAGTEITTDEVHTRTIFYNGNLRKRIKIVKPLVGWVTVETEKGKLYGRKH